MAGITRAEVAHLARLARIAMTDDELDHMSAQLDLILVAVARVGEAWTPRTRTSRRPRTRCR